MKQTESLMLERIWKAVTGVIEVSSRHLPEVTEEEHEASQRGILSDLGFSQRTLPSSG
jgi:hypothetical protein